MILGSNTFSFTSVMQTLLLPAGTTGGFTAAPSSPAVACSGSAPRFHGLIFRQHSSHSLSLPPYKSFQSLTSSSFSSASSSSSDGALHRPVKLIFSARASSLDSPTSSPPNDDSEEAKLAQVLSLSRECGIFKFLEYTL